jgi:nucleotide-binding universal stress UspA family protein
MRQIKNILAPTDLSRSSLPGLRYALDLAKALGAEVTVYQVLGDDEFLRYGEKLRAKLLSDPEFRVPDPFLKEYQTALRQFVEKHFSDLINSVRFNEEVEVGSLDKKIVERAKSQPADLIVMSTHSRGALARLLMGSVTEKVVRDAPCPVLSIRTEVKERTTERLVLRAA